MKKPAAFAKLLLVALCTALAGCQAASGDYWRSPSILNTAPPDPPKQKKREPSGGFSILVDAPGQPTVTRAASDIAAFAQRHGFARQGGGSDAQHFSNGKVALDVVYRASDSRVIANLHGFALNEKFSTAFYRDFAREYGHSYGEENPIIQNDYLADSMF